MNFPHSDMVATMDESAHYAPEAVGTLTLEGLEGADRYARWAVNRLRDGLGNRVLELGAGTGTITRLLLPRDLVVAVDISEYMTQRLAVTFANEPRVRVVHRDVTRSVEELAAMDIDSAITVNVLEHVQDDVAAMRAIHEILRPGGTLNVLVPAHPVLYGDFDRLIGHHRRYTRRELAAKLEASGFQVRWTRYSNPVGALGWFVKMRLLRQKALTGVRGFDRLVPALAALEDFVKPPFGLSVLASAVKARE